MVFEEWIRSKMSNRPMLEEFLDWTIYPEEQPKSLTNNSQNYESRLYRNVSFSFGCILLIFYFLFPVHIFSRVSTRGTQRIYDFPRSGGLPRAAERLTGRAQS